MFKPVAAYVCIFVLIIITCSAQISLAVESTPAFPIKIGLLADSQITTEKGSHVFIYRNGRADVIQNVAIRPPALDELSEDMLEYALDTLYKENVDVILYLGDAVNSGGEDEFKVFFERLERVQSKRYEGSKGLPRRPVPIFIVIGNHDYLGAGNTSDIETRVKLLNRNYEPYNKPLKKYEVAQKIHEFNRKSATDPAYKRDGKTFTYKDNFDTLTPEMTHEDGLYLAGLVEYAGTENVPVEIMLADTSDYYKGKSKPILGKLGGYGLKGGISVYPNNEENHDGFQVNYLAKMAEKANTNPIYRLVAAHYPLKDLHLWYTSDKYQTKIKAYLKFLALDSGKNYWISGHTHIDMSDVASTVSEFQVGSHDDGVFNSINIGSTIDKRAHVVVLGGKDVSNDALTGNGGLYYKTIPLFNKASEADKKLYDDIKSDVEAIRKGDNPSFCTQNKEFVQITWPNPIICPEPAMVGAIDWRLSIYPDPNRYGYTFLGLDKKYRDKDVNEDAFVELRKNARAFADWEISKHPDCAEKVIPCLCYIAAMIEDGKPL